MHDQLLQAHGDYGFHQRKGKGQTRFHINHSEKLQTVVTHIQEQARQGGYVLRQQKNRRNPLITIEVDSEQGNITLRHSPGIRK